MMRLARCVMLPMWAPLLRFAISQNRSVPALAAALRAILSIMASISEITSSGAAFCTMWPTLGNLISYTFGTAAANGREWMLVDTVLSTSPAITTVGALMLA